MFLIVSNNLSIQTLRIIVIAICFSVLPTGCSNSLHTMNRVEKDTVSTLPDKDKSLIVFYRPKHFFASLMQSSIFEINGNDPSLIGLIASKEMAVYQVDPGYHLFMVIGESADYMSAKTDANKTYYAKIRARQGVGIARFSFIPLNQSDISSTHFRNEISECSLLQKNENSQTWFKANKDDILSKHLKYMPSWNNKKESEKQKLNPYDGIEEGR